MSDRVPHFRPHRRITCHQVEPDSEVVELVDDVANHCDLIQAALLATAEANGNGIDLPAQTLKPQGHYGQAVLTLPALRDRVH